MLSRREQSFRNGEHSGGNQTDALSLTVKLACAPCPISRAETSAFFVRADGLSLAGSGSWVGLTSGVGSVAGMVIGGAYAIRLVSRDRRWECWLPAASLAAALPIYLVTYLWPDVRVALGRTCWARSPSSRLRHGSGELPLRDALLSARAGGAACRGSVLDRRIIEVAPTTSSLPR